MKIFAAALPVVMTSVALFGCFEDDNRGTNDVISTADTQIGDTTATGPADFTWNNYPATLEVYFEWDNPENTVPPGMTFSWDFGDGQTGTGWGVTHDYAVPGEYTVRLDVKFASGKEDFSTKIVTVTGYGVTKWKYEFLDTESGRETGAGSVALAEDGTIYSLIYTVGGAHAVYSISPAGEKNWRFTEFENPETGACADPVWSDGSNTLYVICNLRLAATQFTGVITALDKNGTLKWTAYLPDGRMMNRAAVVMKTDPADLTDTLYIGTDIGPEVDQAANIYTVNHAGDVTQGSFESDADIIGLAMGPGNRLYVVADDGRIDALSDNLGAIWHFEPAGPIEPTGYLAVDALSRVFVTMKSPASLMAFHADSGTPLLYTIDLNRIPGAPSMDAAGHVCILGGSTGIACYDAADGTLAWSAVENGGITAMAALINGMLVAEMGLVTMTYDKTGNRTDWTIAGTLTGVAAVADDGTLYLYGHRDLETMYSDALYAVYGPADLIDSWTRYRGNNANTASF